MVPPPPPLPEKCKAASPPLAAGSKAADIECPAEAAISLARDSSRKAEWRHSKPGLLSLQKKGKLADNKIHVQNERTFLSWFSTACFIILIGVSLLRKNPPVGEPITKGWPFIFGMMVIVYAIIIILYAAWQYFRRLDAFARNLHDSEFQYYDRIGPAALVLGFLLIVITGLALDAVDGSFNT
jgi:uncharacterized membrane protein YidH (DUF202 family)